MSAVDSIGVSIFSFLYASIITKITELKLTIASIGPAGPYLKAMCSATTARVAMVLPMKPMLKLYWSNGSHS